jgi:hypothetical protein
MPQGGGTNEVLGVGGKYFSIPLIISGRYEELPSYFYDTHRGRKDTNDCVHSKLISQLGKPGYTQYWYKYGNRVDCPVEFVSPGLISSYGFQFRPCWYASIGETRWFAIGISMKRISVTRYKVTNITCNCYLYRYVKSSDRWALAGITGGVSWLSSDELAYQMRVSVATCYDFPKNPFSEGDLLGQGRLSESYASAMEAMDDIFNSLKESLMSNIQYLSQYSGSPNSTSYYTSFKSLVLDEGSVPSLDQLKSDLTLSEVELTQEGLDPLQIPNIQYWRNWLVQHAYLDALQSAPRLNENSISNVIEIVGFIKHLVVDHRIEIPKSLQSAWLSYRYQVTTSRLDAKEAIEFVHRNMDLGGLDKGIKCFGSAIHEVNGKLVTCRCSLRLTPKELGLLASIWRSLYTYGLQPNFYVLWDMIPYSFIVDWFIPLGDIASVLDAEAMFMDNDNYDISDVCFSLSYDTKKDNYSSHQYSRWRSQPLAHFNEFYWLDKPSTSNRTLVYRILDTASLCIGR